MHACMCEFGVGLGSIWESKLDLGSIWVRLEATSSGKVLSGPVAPRMGVHVRVDVCLYMDSAWLLRAAACLCMHEWINEWRGEYFAV